MVWAGAMVEVFEAYQADFGAKLHHLVSNYRSAPELVRMQHVIAQALETGTPPAKAARTGLSGGCVVLEFSNPEEEAAHVAAMIGRGVGEGMGPRDFCILVRQRTAEMIGPLKTELGKQGIRLRDESELQDLLAEPVVEFLLAVLRLATRPRDAEAWELLTSRIMMLLGTDDGDDGTMVERQSRLLVEHARAGMALDHSNPALPAELVGLLGADVFRAAHRQYRSGSFLDDVLGRLAKALQTSAGICASAREAVDDLIGANVVPAMTIHKSKGLEFHTVIFLGLEDSQWWGFANQPDEEKRGFFVAFSRAAERVFFTFSDLRDGRWRREPQARDGIGDLYAILQKAGVPTEDLRL
jgi:superfamily I DNA/RNA helicase